MTLPSVLVCTPKYAGLAPVHQHSVRALEAHAKARGIKLDLLDAQGAPPDAARDMLAAAFVKSGFDLMFMVDSGIGFGVETFDRLYAAAGEGYEFLAAAAPLRRHDTMALPGVTPARTSPRFAVTFWELGPVTAIDPVTTIDIAGQRYVKVGKIGAAMLLLSRSVFTKIAESCPHLHYGEGSVAYFIPAIIGGERCAEDIAFCERWCRTGGAIWTLIDAPLVHEGPATFSDNLANLVKAKT